MVEVTFGFLLTALGSCLVYIFHQVRKEVAEIKTAVNGAALNQHNFTKTIFLLLRKLNPEHREVIAEASLSWFAQKQNGKAAN